MLVLDASVVYRVGTGQADLTPLDDDDLAGPPLLWPEVRSVLHVARWRGLLSDEFARQGLRLLQSGAIRERRPHRLGEEAWRVADHFGWAKTYDAEYLALASLLNSPLVTFDRRMRRAADELGLRTVLPRG